MPTAMPTTIDSTVAAVTSLSVISNRPPRSSITGCWVRAEIPKSPWSDVAEPQEVAGDGVHVEVERIGDRSPDRLTRGRVGDLGRERQRVAGVRHQHVDDERRAEDDEERGDQAAQR